GGRRAKRVPLVRTIHNAVIWTPWRRMGRWCERRMRATHAAAVSRAALDAYARFRRESGAGALPVEPAIVYNGVPEDPAGREIGGRRRGGGATRILFAGRLDKQKGADLLHDIMRRVDPVDGRINELVIFGSGDLEEQVRVLKEDPPNGWVVRVEGPVADLRR